ncbi:unnamed protein product [Miscanthus lutarioriparius]|uniref:Uncharacterized protein n=1 Tax=Miscanthus lutarioriparius TaxID=422564 RepID=A0A811QBF4_9POAL|nr:unnamed protein product [Miscanthus lutarioriparius]
MVAVGGEDGGGGGDEEEVDGGGARSGLRALRAPGTTPWWKGKCEHDNRGGVELEMNGQTYAHTNSHQSGAIVKLASAATFITSSFTQGSNPMAPGIPWSRISAETP